MPVMHCIDVKTTFQEKIFKMLKVLKTWQETLFINVE